MPEMQSEIKIDFFTEFFTRGLHGIMESIILVMPPRTLCACQEVSNHWSDIVHHYCDSRNERFLRRSDIRLDQEWRKKDPMIKKICLEKFGVREVDKCFHMTSDMNHLIVAASCILMRHLPHPIFKCTYGVKIFVIDFRTFAIIQVLEVEDDNIYGVRDVKLAMDENFLIAYISEHVIDWCACFDEEIPSDRISYRVWRRPDYIAFPHRQPCEKEKSQIINAKLANVPLLLNGCLLIFIREIFDEKGHGIEYNEWNLNKNSLKEVRVCQRGVPNIKPGHYYRQRNGTRALEVLHCAHIRWGQVWPDVGILVNGIFQRATISGTYKIIGISDDYLVVYLKSEVYPKNETKSYRVEDGQIKYFRELFEDSFRPDPDDEVQFNNKRVAYMCLKEYDYQYSTRIVIGDLSSGKIILDSYKDLGFRKVGCFNLQKHCLSIEAKGQLYLAKFCA